jgi:ribonuclease H / adenosylcobalamin/alpha-ribazole phosphatase
VRLFVLSRHAHSTLNLEGRVNGDPSVDVPLTDDGRAQARRLGEQLANMPLELCVHTRFGRTRDTAEGILQGRDVPLHEEPLLDDIDVGELEGETVAAYRAWKADHDRADRFPGGESLDEAARRYGLAFRALLERAEQAVLVVCHEIPIRYALNAASGSDELDGPVHAIPNATPYLFDEHALARAAQRLGKITR